MPVALQGAILQGRVIPSYSTTAIASISHHIVRARQASDDGTVCWWGLLGKRSSRDLTYRRA